MINPSAEQRAIRDESNLALTVLAPAGCGKTEALALRVAGLIERKEVQPPQKVLVLTFSNRARDNARDRLRSHLSPSSLRSTVAVSNLHGFAGRVIKAHGELIGLQSSLELPKSDWVTEQCRARDFSYGKSAAAARALRVAKQQARGDQQVLQVLIDGGNQDAVEIERQRQSEGTLTYDDLLRLAELILAHDGAADLYRHHFGCVIVDEFQDLTPQQLRVIQRIGYRRTTYAGDIAQGIYSFTGADPEAVLAEIRDETKLELPLSESYRSSPAVLDTINSLNLLTGGTELRCATRVSWPGGGLATGCVFSTVNEEATWVVNFARRILSAAPSQRIGVIARAGSRRRFVDEAFAREGMPWHRWDDPLMDAATCAYMKKVVGRVRVDDFRAAEGGIGYLIDLADLAALDDPDTRKGVVEALGWVADALNDGTPIDEIADRIKVAHSTRLLQADGVHLLSGHVGKGQQFDWVVVIGLEEGCIPNFNAVTQPQLREEARVLSVMLSRARHGLAVTRSTHVPTLKGLVRPQDPSRFAAQLRASNVLTGPDATDGWFDAADWAAIAAR